MANDLRKNKKKEVVGPPRKMMDTTGLPRLGGEEKEPVERFIGPYSRTELPTKRPPTITRGPRRSVTPDPDLVPGRLVGDSPSRVKFSENPEFNPNQSDTNNIKDPEAGKTFKSTRMNRIDPEKNRTLTGERNPMGRSAGLLEQRRAAEEGDVAAYRQSTAARGTASDIGAKNGVGGFCVNCDTPIPDVEAAVETHKVRRPGGWVTKFAPSTRDDSHCATCDAQSASITSEGQAALRADKNVQRPRG